MRTLPPFCFTGRKAPDGLRSFMGEQERQAIGKCRLSKKPVTAGPPTSSAPRQLFPSRPSRHRVSMPKPTMAFTSTG
jgi:hypothetical protein